MMLRRELGPMLAAVAMAAAAGCAPMTTTPAKPASAAAPPAATTTAPATPAETSRVATPTGTAIDTTTPSPQAQSVLARIPEPLTPAQQALSPAQDTTRTHVTAIAPAATYDSLQAAPVPAATQPLGTETSTVTMAPATSAAATSPAAPGTAAAGAAAGTGPGAAAGAAGAAAAAATTGADSTKATSPCWRLQVAAPLASEKEKADGRVEAAQSLLMVPFTIVPEKGYLKVRTSDCMTREAADALKQRAIASGFDGAFLVDTSAKPAPASTPPHKSAHVPASKRKK